MLQKVRGWLRRTPQTYRLVQRSSNAKGWKKVCEYDHAVAVSEIEDLDPETWSGLQVIDDNGQFHKWVWRQPPESPVESVPVEDEPIPEERLDVVGELGKTMQFYEVMSGIFDKESSRRLALAKELLTLQPLQSAQSVVAGGSDLKSRLDEFKTLGSVLRDVQGLISPGTQIDRSDYPVALRAALDPLAQDAVKNMATSVTEGVVGTIKKSMADRGASSSQLSAQSLASTLVPLDPAEYMRAKSEVESKRSEPEKGVKEARGEKRKEVKK